jgi:hypothetical protein
MAIIRPQETRHVERLAHGDRAAADAAFHSAHSGYAGTTVLDELRATNYSRLDNTGHVCLDYTGGGLYAESQLREHFELLRGNVFGNPHSLNPTSAASTELVERARARVLEFFRASPEEYVAIFTPNATGALRLVGEAYPFHPGTVSCLRSTTTTRSTAFASSRAPAALRRPTSRASRPICASTSACCSAT